MKGTRVICGMVLVGATVLKPSLSLAQTSRSFSNAERAEWTELFRDMKDESEDGSACHDVAETALDALVITQEGSQYNGDVFVWRWNYIFVFPNGDVAHSYHDPSTPVPGYPGMHWLGVGVNKLESVSPGGDSTWVARSRIEIYWTIVHETRHHAGYGETAVDWWIANVAADCEVPEEEIPEPPSGGGGSDDPPPPGDDQEEEEEEEEDENEVEVTIKCTFNCDIG